MRFGVCAGPESAGDLKDAGFDYIELSVSGHLKPFDDETAVMSALKEQLAVGGLRSEAFNGMIPGELRITGPAATIDTARQNAYFSSAFHRAAALGGKTVVFGSGAARRVPEGFSKAEAAAQIVDFLQRAGNYAYANGIIIAIEPLNHHECNILNSVDEAMKIAARVSHPSVKVLSDQYHVEMDGQSFDETADAGDMLAHVHVAKLEGRKAPQMTDVPRMTEYFRALRTAGYDSRISVEGNWDDLKSQAREALNSMKTAWENSAS